MGVMSPVWEGLRSSRMALLAVNALLLSTTSNCGVVAAAVAAVPSWDASSTGGRMISLGRSIATLPQTLTASSPRRSRARIEQGSKLGRHRDDESNETTCNCASKRSAVRRDRTSPREERRRHAASSTASDPTTNRERHGLLSRRLLDGSRATPPQNGEALWRKVLGPRAASAAAAAVEPTSSTGGGIIAQQQQRQPLLGRGLVRRLRSRGVNSSSHDSDDRPLQIQRLQRHQKQEDQRNIKTRGPASSSPTTATTTTTTTTTTTGAAAANPPVRLAKGSAAARAVKKTAAATTAIAPTSPSPTPSYLRWPTAVTDDTRQTAGSEPNCEQDVKRLRKKGRQLLALGVGSHTGRADSGADSGRPNSGADSSVDSDTNAPTNSSGRKGSLRAAKASRGGAGAGAVSLTFKEAMFAGAVSRSLAQTCMQPANVVKTLLQGRGTASQLSNLSFKLLTRGAGAQFVMSMPHGAFNFATLEVILGVSAKVFPTEWREKAGPVLDFVSSSVATLVCSVVSTPQMVLTDRIMAGMYPNLLSGVREISRTQGLKGFYIGWSANVAQKIPSYGLTWVFFQQFKRLHRKATDRPPTNTENFVLGAAAAGATVCLMIPMDTVKTRLVTQTIQPGVVPYKGVLQTLSRIVKEEGFRPIYRSLTPRLVSVVPMIGIQFGIYEFIRTELMNRKVGEHKPRKWIPPAVRRRFGIGGNLGLQQPEYAKDFLKNVYLLEEELV